MIDLSQNFSVAALNRVSISTAQDLLSEPLQSDLSLLILPPTYGKDSLIKDVLSSASLFCIQNRITLPKLVLGGHQITSLGSLRYRLELLRRGLIFNTILSQDEFVLSAFLNQDITADLVAQMLETDSFKLIYNMLDVYNKKYSARLELLSKKKEDIKFITDQLVEIVSQAKRDLLSQEEFKLLPSKFFINSPHNYTPAMLVSNLVITSKGYNTSLALNDNTLLDMFNGDIINDSNDTIVVATQRYEPQDYYTKTYNKYSIDTLKAEGKYTAMLLYDNKVKMFQIS